MHARIGHITVDCRDPHGLARFWGQITGYLEDPSDPNLPGHDEALILDPTRRHPGLLFIRVPDDMRAKNRVHLDLTPAVGTRDMAVDRALGIGATLIDDRRNPDGSGWVVLGDPEGNEFCIVRSAAERPGHVPPRHTGERPFPAVRTADELTMVTSMLDWYRDGVITKVAGLTDAQAGPRPLPSLTSISGIVKHLALVEDHWFGLRVGGLPLAATWADVDFDADPDWEFRTAVDDGIHAVTAMYRDACAKSRSVMAGRALDDPAAGPDSEGRPVTVRWVVVHLIEETARHLGHLDIVRELIDGSTGE